MVQLTLQSLSNDIYIHFALEKEIEKLYIVLKNMLKHCILSLQP